MTCDVIGIAHYHFLKSIVKIFLAFHGRLAFENVSNRTKIVLVTLTALSTRNLSKMLLL